MAKTWTVETIREAIMTSTVMVERSILELFNRQTADEQTMGATRHHNAMGFNGPDAEFMSSLAGWILRSSRVEGSRLSPKQIVHARKKLPKYARQLLEVAEAKKAPAPKPVAVVDMETYRNRSNVKQNAWSDDWTEEHALLVPTATDAEIHRYVSSFNQSSQGRLRWNSYQYEGRTLDGYVIIRVSQHLCD